MRLRVVLERLIHSIEPPPMHVYVMRLCSSFAADDGEMESVSSASVPKELSCPQL